VTPTPAALPRRVRGRRAYRNGEGMRLVLVLDCADADALADFWASALEFRRVLRPPDGDERLQEI
jgi:hypothetical protein